MSESAFGESVSINISICESDFISNFHNRGGIPTSKCSPLPQNLKNMFEFICPTVNAGSDSAKH